MGMDLMDSTDEVWQDPDGTTENRCPDCEYFDYGQYIDRGSRRYIKCTKCGHVRVKMGRIA